MGAYETKAKQFLPRDYSMTLYERFHKLVTGSVEDYTEFNNPVARVELSESSLQFTARYLVGLQISVRDEFSVERIVTLEEAYFSASQSEERVTRLGP